MDVKTAIITGGAQGIGKAACLYFRSKGIRVFAADYDEEAGNELNSHEGIQYIHCDVSSEDQVRNLIDLVLNQAGQLHYLVNNAGVSEFPSLEEITLDQWNRIIGINLTGAFLCSKYAATALKRSNGRIVNIASTRALMAEPGNEAYSASKGGIVALTTALANSLGPEVLVNAISPGWIEVAEWKKNSLKKKPELSSQDHQQHPAGRVGTPEDIAQLIWFLCAEQNGFITGQNFVADGGMTKKMIYWEG